MIVLSKEHERFYEILNALRAKHPDDKELLDELSIVVCDCMNQSERIGVERHGIQILQMIKGARYQYEGCTPLWVDTDGDDERWYDTEKAEAKSS